MRSPSLLDERFASLASAMPIGVLELDHRGCCLFANAKACELTGRGAEALAGHGWLAALHRSDRLEVEGVWELGSETFAGQVRIASPRRKARTVRLHLEAAQDGWVATLGELAPGLEEEQERRRMEQALESMKAQMRQMVDNNPALVTVKDLDLRYTLVNREYERVFGVSEAEVMGKRDDWGSEHDGEVLRREEPLQVEQQLMVGGEARTYVSHKFPLREPSGALYAVATVSVDITSRERIAQDLERSNRDLEQVASVASHDLAEPLRTISGFAHLLRDRHAHQLDETGQGFVDRITQGTERMEKLLSDVLAYARVGSGERLVQPIALNGLVVEVLEGLEALIQEKDAVVTVGKLPTVPGDPALLRQLFGNLLGNALKFTDRDQPRVQVLAKKGAGTWTVSVRDNGIGMEPGDREHIFEMFARVHGRSAFDGTGIGLALCKRIAELHGGSIEVKSKPGKGSTFAVTLPAA